MITLEQVLIDDHQNQARAALGMLQELRSTAINLYATDDISQQTAFLNLYVALCGSTGDFTNSQEACADFERWIKA